MGFICFDPSTRTLYYDSTRRGLWDFTRELVDQNVNTTVYAEVSEEVSTMVYRQLTRVI